MYVTGINSKMLCPHCPLFLVQSPSRLIVAKRAMGTRMSGRILLSWLWRYIYDKIQYSVFEIKSSKSGMHQSKVGWQQADSVNTHSAKGQNARRQNPKMHHANRHHAKRQKANSHYAERHHAKRHNAKTQNAKRQNANRHHANWRHASRHHANRHNAKRPYGNRQNGKRQNAKRQYANGHNVPRACAL